MKSLDLDCPVCRKEQEREIACDVWTGKPLVQTPADMDAWMNKRLKSQMDSLMMLAWVGWFAVGFCGGFWGGFLLGRWVKGLLWH